MLADIKSTFKNSLIYGLGNLSSKLVGLILLPLYTSYLTVADYGTLGILEVSGQIFAGIFGLGLAQGFSRWYWDKRYVHTQKALFFSVLIFLLMTTFVITFLFSLVSDKLSWLLFNKGELSLVLRLMFLSSALDIVILIPNSLIRLQEKPVLFTVANIIKLTVSLTLTVYFITGLNLQIKGIYYAQICGQVIFILILSSFIKRNLQFHFEKVVFIDMLKYSIPLALSSIAALALSISDRYILRFLGGLEAVGLYSLGFKMANTIYVFVVSSVNLAVTPMIYKKMDEPEHKRFYTKLLTYYVFGVLICVMGMSFFGKEVIKVLSSSTSYYNAHKVIPILSFSILFIVMRDTSMIGLQKVQKSKIIAATVFLAAAINIMLDFILIKFFKTIGAATATLCSQGIYFLLIYYLSQRAYKIPYEAGKLVKMLLTAVFLTLVALSFNDSSFYIRIPVKFFLIILFPVILYFLNFYEKVELEKIQGFWIKWRNPINWRKNLKL